MMDLAALLTFCRTIEAGNMTAAARALNVTKSVASRRLKALEEETGVTLLMRSTRGVAPTDAGRELYDRASRILKDLDEAKQAVQEDGSTLTGRLRLTAPRSFTEIVLREPFGRFIKAHPDVEVDMTLSDSRTDIIGGGFDVAFRIARSLDDSSLKARKLCEIRNVLVASPGYLEEYGTPKQPRDLDQHRAIKYSHLSMSQSWIFQDVGSGGVGIRIKGALSTNSGIMQADMVRQGLGLVVMPRFFVAEDLAKGSMVELLHDTPPIISHLYALMPDITHRPARVRAMIDMVEAHVRAPEQTANL